MAILKEPKEQVSIMFFFNFYVTKETVSGNIMRGGLVSWLTLRAFSRSSQGADQVDGQHSSLQPFSRPCLALLRHATVPDRGRAITDTRSFSREAFAVSDGAM